jgi:hypothetical protein
MRLPLINRSVGLGTGLAVGLGVAILAPMVLPLLAAIVRPIAKGAIKTGMVLFQKGRIMAAEAVENLEDLAAEAKAEMAAEEAVVPEAAAKAVRKKIN